MDFRNFQSIREEGTNGKSAIFNLINKIVSLISKEFFDQNYFDEKTNEFKIKYLENKLILREEIKAKLLDNTIEVLDVNTELNNFVELTEHSENMNSINILMKFNDIREKSILIITHIQGRIEYRIIDKGKSYQLTNLAPVSNNNILDWLIDTYLHKIMKGYYIWNWKSKVSYISLLIERKVANEFICICAKNNLPDILPEVLSSYVNDYKVEFKENSPVSCLYNFTLIFKDKKMMIKENYSLDKAEKVEITIQTFVEEEYESQDENDNLVVKIRKQMSNERFEQVETTNDVMDCILRELY